MVTFYLTPLATSFVSSNWPPVYLSTLLLLLPLRLRNLPSRCRYCTSIFFAADIDFGFVFGIAPGGKSLEKSLKVKLP